MSLQQRSEQKMQSLILPRLEQFIRILQQNSQELHATIEQKLLTNPLLEIDDDQDWIATEEPQEDDEDLRMAMDRSAQDGSAFDWEARAAHGESEDWRMEYTPTEARDEGWDEGVAANRQSWETDDGKEWRREQKAETTSLDSIRQAALAQAHNEIQRWLIEILIGYLEDSGLLLTPLETIAEVIENEVRENAQQLPNRLLAHYCHEDWKRLLAQALLIIQAQEPAGIGAQSTQECCRLQINRWKNHAIKKAALVIIDCHYQALLSKDFALMRNALGYTQHQLQEVLSAMATLQLQPLSAEENHQAPIEYLEPDVVVRKINHEWVVRLNAVAHPRVHMNQYYEKLIYQKRGMEKIQAQAYEARHFINDLGQRSLLILRVARYLVHYQRNFFELGEIGLRPLTQLTIAESMGITSSTISRTMQGKTMDTPRGVLPFSHFIDSARIRSDMGAKVSSKAVGAIIRSIINAEDPKNPLSDELIVGKLSENGINLSRRMVAHHRLGLGIATHHQRLAR